MKHYNITRFKPPFIVTKLIWNRDGRRGGHIVKYKHKFNSLPILKDIDRKFLVDNEGGYIDCFIVIDSDGKRVCNLKVRC